MAFRKTFDATRRGVLRSMIAGSMLLPALATQLMAEEASVGDPLAPKPTHFPAKAKRVIFLYMSGGVSHIDSFDPKPKLFADGGKTIQSMSFRAEKAISICS